MEKLIQLAQIVKECTYGDIILTANDDKTAKITLLYDMIINGKITTDDDAFIYLYEITWAALFSIYSFNLL